MHLMQIRRTIILLLAILGCTTSDGQQSAAMAPPPKNSFHIYLLMGQSNMVGRDTRGLAAQADDPRILTLNTNGEWVVARDPLHSSEGRIPPGVGPGISFAAEMLKADPTITIGLVPCAVGGTPLRRWVKGGDLYEKAVKRAKLAAQTGVIEGVLWHQGETDTSSQKNAETYEVRLTQMFKDLRADLDQPDLPIVVGQLGNFLEPGKYPYVETVRAAIKHMPAVMPHVGYADSTGLGDKGDKLHFSSEAQREFGTRYAKAMQEISADAVGAPPTARIAHFDGDRAAAISYTFDDNLRDQYTVAVPMLNEVGFKGTFFVIAGVTSETVEDAEKKDGQKRAWGGITWSELKTMDAQGHEIASHTWTHPNLTKSPPEEVDVQFSKAYDAIKTHIGKPPLTLAFPFNASTPEIQTAALKYHVAYRAYQLGTGSNSTVKSLNSWADKLVQEKKWGVTMTHAITNGYAAMSSPEILRDHWKYVKSRDREIWVDTFANIARYEKERGDAKLTLSEKAGTLTCVLTSTLDPQLYDVPLTLVVDAAGATSPHAERAGKKLPSVLRNGSIYIQAAPSLQPITVTWK